MRTRVEVVLVAVACLFGASVVPAAAAGVPRSPDNCLRGMNDFVDISDSLSGSPVRKMGFKNQKTLTLEVGQVAGARRAWAKLVGPLLPDESVWMDISQDNGAHWYQCGPFLAHEKDSITTPAKRHPAGSFERLRACGWIINSVSCTDWW